MTLEALRRALADSEGEAVVTCLDLLDDAHADARVDLDSQRVPTANLLTIYRRRADHVEEIGLPTQGFREAVARLTATPHETLRLAIATSAKGYPWCVVFLAPEQMEVVAAIAVLGQMTPS